MMITTNVGFISCEKCGEYIISYDIDILKNKRPEDTVVSMDFFHIDGVKIQDGEMMICKHCGTDYYQGIHKAWSDLRKNKEWDTDENTN